MILRKPYAFLIKYFRAIHIVLAVLLVYMLVKTTAIISFFHTFASGGDIPSISNLAAYYINFFMYGAVILILGVAITIYFLMSNKQKKTTFYIFLIGYYIFLFILLSVAYSVLADIQTELISSQAANVYRDVSLILYLPQYFFVFFSAFRGIGFDIKKFNFNLDLEELKIEEKDNEEIEVLIVTDAYKYKRKARRFIREFKYYFRENTFIFCCVIGLSIVIIGTAIFLNRSVYRKVYREGQTFTYKSFTLTNLDSMITSLDYGGNVINNGKYYLVINMNVKTFSATAITLEDFRLLVGNKIYYPTLSKREYFIDYGNPYSGEKLKRNMDKDYLLVYELDASQVKKQYRLRIVDNFTYKVGTIIPTYKELVLKPTVVDKVSVVGSYAKNDEVKFSKSSLKNSYLNISDYLITDNYRYTYEYCYMEQCTELQGAIPVDKNNSANILLVLNYSLSLADTYYKNNIKGDRYFFANFVKVRYIFNGKTKTTTFTNKTPNQFTDKLVLQLNEEIKNASAIEVLITIRNKQYVVKLL